MSSAACSSSLSVHPSEVVTILFKNAGVGGGMAQLKRVLSFPVLLLITVNAIMGTGIYFLIGFGAQYAGAGSLISWVIIGLFSI